MDEYNNETIYVLYMLIDYKMDLDLVLNKGEEPGKDIIDIIAKLKIPSIKTKGETISGINLVTFMIKKYAKIYKINQSEEKNNENFMEKLNILLGIPIPEVKQGEAIIKYLSCKYQDKSTILTNAFYPKEIKKEYLGLLKPLFLLFNINETIFNYINKLPAPNSYKFSFVDYYIKLFLLIENEIEDNNLKKELNDLINEISSKYNKDINNIKNSEIIDLDNKIILQEMSLQTVNNISLPEKIILMQGKRHYISGKNLQKTTENEPAQSNNIPNSNEGNNNNENILNKDDKEIHVVLYVVLVSEIDQDINIDFKPYFYSNMEIKAKKDKKYYIYCIDVNDNIKNNEEEIFKLIDYNNIKIKASESKIDVLPEENKNQTVPADDGCSINCPICGAVNVIDEGNVEFICLFCGSSLF